MPKANETLNKKTVLVMRHGRQISYARSVVAISYGSQAQVWYLGSLEKHMREWSKAVCDNTPSLYFIGCEHLLDGAGLRGPILASEA